MCQKLANVGSCPDFVKMRVFRIFLLRLRKGQILTLILTHRKLEESASHHGVSQKRGEAGYSNGPAGYEQVHGRVGRCADVHRPTEPCLLQGEGWKNYKHEHVQRDTGTQSNVFQDFPK